MKQFPLNFFLTEEFPSNKILVSGIVQKKNGWDFREYY